MAIWEVMRGDNQLMSNVIKHLLEVLSLTLPYQEKSRTSATSGVISYQRTETSVPKAVRIDINMFVNGFFNLGISSISNFI